MSFLDVLSRVSDEDIADILGAVTDDEILSTLSKPKLAIDDALILLSPQALLYLEDMAQMAHERTVQQFGYTIQLFTPMYISNYCDNGCVYCGYSHHSGIAREKLSLEDIELALLGKFIFFEEIEMSRFNFLNEIFKERQYDYIWQESYIEYMKNQVINKINNIQNYIMSL